MTAAFESERLFRVLCLFPHPRFTGHVVLDETGLLRSGTFTMRTRRFPSLPERIASIESRLQRSVASFRPDVVAVVTARGGLLAEGSWSPLVAAAGPSALRVRVVEETELDELFRLPDGAGCDRLGQCVTGVFFPELIHRTRSWHRGSAQARRHVRPMWRAAAGAVAVLAEHRPASARSLALGPLPPGLASFIERASGAQPV